MTLQPGYRFEREWDLASVKAAELELLNGFTASTPTLLSKGMNKSPGDVWAIFDNYMKGVVRDSGLIAGDLVKVHSKILGYWGGWSDNWTPRLDKTIGKIFQVDCIDGLFIIAHDIENIQVYTIPLWALEMVKHIDYETEPFGGEG